jgi:hypothetical protein
MSQLDYRYSKTPAGGIEHEITHTHKNGIKIKKAAPAAFFCDTKPFTQSTAQSKAPPD